MTDLRVKCIMDVRWIAALQSILQSCTYEQVEVHLERWGVHSGTFRHVFELKAQPRKPKSYAKR
jgi:hypothetical protein